MPCYPHRQSNALLSEAMTLSRVSGAWTLRIVVEDQRAHPANPPYLALAQVLTRRAVMMVMMMMRSTTVGPGLASFAGGSRDRDRREPGGLLTREHTGDLCEDHK